MELKKKLSRILVITLTACLVLTACGSDDDDDDDSEEKATKVSATTPDPDEESSKEEESSEDESTQAEDVPDGSKLDEPAESKEDTPSSEDTPDSTPAPSGDKITESELIGVWSSFAVEEDGTLYTVDDEEYGEMVKNFMTIDFYNDGTGVLKSTYFDDQESFDWTITDNGVDLDQDGDTLSATYEGKKLVIADDELKVAFEKTSDIAVKDDSEPDESEDESEDESKPDKPTPADEKSFVGTWKSVAMEEGDEKYTLDDEEYGEIIKDFLTIELRSGGTGTVTMMMFDESESEDFDWWVGADNKLTLSQDGDEIYAELKGGQLVLDLEGTLVYLEKTN